MEIALQGQSFTQPLNVSQTNPSCILWIEATSPLKFTHEYTHQGINFYHIPSIDEASLLIREGKLKVDAAVISPEHTTSDILTIRDDAHQQGIPLIMYTSVFSQKAKSRTVGLGIDEYHNGAIGHTFLKRIEFLKKLKKYKNHQSYRMGMVMYLKALPKIGRWALKRTFDLFGSFIALVAFSPIFLLIAAIIKLGSNGPVFLVCKRVGMGYNIFDLYKFRTKADDEDDLGASNFGKFLADSGLDELPSLLNVLKGDMSLVGSRPLLLSEAEKLTRDQVAVRLMTPIGITGLWRINEAKTRTQNHDVDMDYVMKSSFWIDVKILLITYIAMPLSQKI